MESMQKSSVGATKLYVQPTNTLVPKIPADLRLRRVCDARTLLCFLADTKKKKKP